MRNFAICNNVDVPRGYYNKGKSQTEEDIKKKRKKTPQLFLKKLKTPTDTDSDTENKLVVVKGTRSKELGKLGEED